MARPTRTDSKVAALKLVRRSLEVRWGWRALLAFMPAAIGAAIVTRGAVSSVAGVVLLAVALGSSRCPHSVPNAFAGDCS
jgi:hypothetical protein